MEPGTKLYKVWSGKLETATFVSENIALGASVPTWLARVPDDTRLHRVSKDFGYVLTELEAWQAEIANYEDSIPHEEQTIRELEMNLEESRQTLARMKGTVAILMHK